MASPMLSMSRLPIKIMIREAPTSCFKYDVFEMAGSRKMESTPI